MRSPTTYDRIGSPLLPRLLVPAVLLLMTVEASQAQPAGSDIRFRHFSMNEGLSHYSISAILQDHTGFLWVGTQNGLNRYDGYTFTPYWSRPNDSTTIAGNTISVLHVDRRGALWAGTQSGLSRYDPVRDRFERFVHRADAPGSLSHDDVWALLETRAGDLWVGTRDGLNRYDPTRRRFVRYGHVPGDTASLSNDWIMALHEGEDGRLWVATRSGLNDFDPATGSARRLLPGTYVRAVHVESPDVLWLGTFGEGLLRLHLPSGRVTSYRHDPRVPTSLAADRIFTLYAEPPHTLWVGTIGGGLDRFDTATGTFTHYRQDLEDGYSLSHNNVHAIYRDRSGGLWVGTLVGLNKYSPLERKFLSYTAQPGRANSLSHAWVHALHEDRSGHLWIGTLSGGLDRFDPATETFTHYRHRPGDPTSLTAGEIWAVCEDRDGMIWVGVMDGGLDRLDPRTGRVRHYRHDPDDPASLSSNRIHSVYEDRSGALWIGTINGGLNRMDRRTGRVTRYAYRKDDPSSLGHDHVWPIYEDRTGTIWIGTVGGGLDRFDPATETFTHYRHRPGDPASLGSDFVVVLNEDREGHLWAGSFDGVLSRLDRETGRFTSYTAAAGLTAGIISGIQPDDEGHLWVSTDDGLFQFDPATEVFTRYDARDGLQGGTFIIGASEKLRSGALVFGGENGFSLIHPREITHNPHVPPVVLTGFRLFNRTVPLDTSITTIREIRLPYHQNFVSFEFAALDFTSPSGNEYAYRLEEVNDGWIQAGTRRTVEYAGLAPGSYTFVVKGSNNDRLWNEVGTSIRLVIEPPFWQTKPFYALVGLLLAGALAGAYRYRVRRLLEVERMRMRIAANLHDDIGANVSSIALKSEIVLLRNVFDEKTAHHVAEIHQTARVTAHTLREIVWVVNSDYDTLDKLVSKMEDLTASMLDGCAVYRFRRPRELPPQRLSMDLRQNVYFLYKELLHNVVKHARAQHVGVDVSFEQGVLTIRLEDDGVGFDEAHVRAGNGLRLMRRRAADVRGTLELSSTPGEGTCATLHVRLA